MEDLEKRKMIHSLMHHSAHRVGIVYDFVTLCSGMASTGLPWKNGQVLTVTEVNIVIEVMRHPGITSTQLCKKWNRTRGAISQLITKLEQKNLIYKEKSEDDCRGIALYPTPEGYRVATSVIANDQEDSSLLFSELIDRGCDEQELRAFYKVMDCYIDVLQDGKHGNWRELLPKDEINKSR